ncbi:VRR-NUC domain-containing protein [Roseomonas sp. NAR14]|uniref:VRR-NUC domain-containing protein n=1 Tax=Roseomonas acroporae TaxID=2937791 RepID=A0A9X2BWW0_9PROT|nr:VRR-NUC domain-containing protein [Roseomonas acroporae]MCK8788203.1 VRR-NUC domain-containing protein [Roseomonas acroporae]
MLVNHALSLADEMDELVPPASPPRKKRGAPERQVMRTIIAWVEAVVPGAIVHHSPNEGMAHSEIHRAIRAGDGVRSGWPDLDIRAPGGIAVLIEVKAPRGVLSDEQDEMIRRLRALGHHVGVANSIETARWVLRQAGVRTIEAGDHPAREAVFRVAKPRSPRLPREAVPL